MSWEYISKNWTILKSAPLPFVIFPLLVLVPAWGIINFIYEKKAETLKISYDGQVEILKQRLASKDDLINEYRQRLHLVDTKKTTYSQLTNNELRSEAEKLVSRMSEYLEEKEQQDRNRSDVHWQQMRKAQSEEERKRLWEAQTSELMRAQPLTSEYNAKFRSDAILLRDELLLRLPKEQRDQRVYRMYEFPVNPIVLWMVINDLERLSKNLPK